MERVLRLVGVDDMRNRPCVITFARGLPLTEEAVSRTCPSGYAMSSVRACVPVRSVATDASSTSLSVDATGALRKCIVLDSELATRKLELGGGQPDVRFLRYRPG